MVGLPAHCTRCGYTFEGRGIAIEGDVQHLVLENNIESCPKCGGAARIVEGEFNVRNGVFEVLRSTRLDRELLQRFAGIARQANDGTIPMEEAAARIAEDAPELGRFLERVPITARKAFIWVLLQALVILTTQVVAESRDHSAITAAVEHAIQRNDTIVHSELQRAVEQALEDFRGHQDDPPTASHETKPGRNDPCPCSSGQKYKRCGGR
jgi:SEC-C motif